MSWYCYYAVRYMVWGLVSFRILAPLERVWWLLDALGSRGASLRGIWSLQTARGPTWPGNAGLVPCAPYPFAHGGEMLSPPIGWGEKILSPPHPMGGIPQKILPPFVGGDKIFGCPPPISTDSPPILALPPLIMGGGNPKFFVPPPILWGGCKFCSPH